MKNFNYNKKKELGTKKNNYKERMKEKKMKKSRKIKWQKGKKKTNKERKEVVYRVLREILSNHVYYKSLDNLHKQRKLIVQYISIITSLSKNPIIND